MVLHGCLPYDTNGYYYASVAAKGKHIHVPIPTY